MKKQTKVCLCNYSITNYGSIIWKSMRPVVYIIVNLPVFVASANIQPVIGL